MDVRTITSLCSSTSEDDSERSGSASKPSNTLGESCRVTPNRRKTSTQQFASSSNSKRENGETPYPVKTSRADFEEKYVQLSKLGDGGYGSVYAGYRKRNHLQVAIKHIPKDRVAYQAVELNGERYMMPTEALLMLRVAGGPSSVGKSAVVSLLDIYDLDQELLLVMERPLPAVDLLTYINDNNGRMEEAVVKNIMKQLVEAALHIHSKGVFHRDIKMENVLIETGSDVPRVWLIDFGCGCTIKETPYRRFSGTLDLAPPEYFIHGEYEAGPTTVWQLGVLLYEMVDGYQQFSTSKFICKTVKFNSELSPDCQDLLKMCLAQDPKKRATLKQMQLHPWLS